jgi:hypothetical protein
VAQTCLGVASAGPHPSPRNTVPRMSEGSGTNWDSALRSIAQAVPGGSFLVLADQASWRLAEWSRGSAGPMVSLDCPGLLGPLSLPLSIDLPRLVEPSLSALATRFGVEPTTGGVFSGPARSPSPPRGVDGSRQNLGTRPAPVLDPGAGVIGCSACSGFGVIAAPCPCGPVAREQQLPCVLCAGERTVAQPCGVCGGVGSFLWPATLTIKRRDGLSGMSGDQVVAIDIDLGACDVLIERSLLHSQGPAVWEDRWVVDLYRPFVQGCRELDVEWPDAIVWVGDVPAVAARVSTSFTLLRVGTPTVRELSIQPLLDEWMVREGAASIPEVLDPEHLGLHAAAIVARLSRGAVVVSPMPSHDELFLECLTLLATAELTAGITVVGSTKVLVALDLSHAPQGVVATGGSVAEMLLNAKAFLSREF